MCSFCYDSLMSHYVLKRSRRAKYMRLTVRAGGEVVLIAPHAFSAASIKRFLARHSRWIEKSASRMQRLKPLPSGKKEYRARREAAREFVHERLAHWNSFYSFNFGRVAIKDTSTLWGSCSRKGNLNFSYKLIFLPRDVADYVIVHELCHLQEHNHSPAFWALVEKAQPEYPRLRRELRKYVLRG
jgi:predicted metal-dependent hydrolase